MDMKSDVGARRANASQERHFYATERAFGRFGMRLFEPTTMDHPHWHGHVEANIVTGAAMIYEVDGQRIIVPPGRMAIFWAGIPHQLLQIVREGDAPPQLANLYLPLDAFLLMPHIGRLQVGLLGGGFALLAPELASPDRMRQWYQDYRSRDPERVSILKAELNAILRRAQVSGMDWLRPSIAEVTEGRIVATTGIRHVVEMVRFILENLASPITNADVAAVTGLHRNYALSLFTETMRLPMKRFIIRMRLQRARALLLESSAAISLVAADAGFSSLSQFYDHFNRAYGMSPNAMRARVGTNAQ